MPFRKTKEEVEKVLELFKLGNSNLKIHKILGFDRSTIRAILKNPDEYLSLSMQEHKFNLSLIDKKNYSFLFGIYLGDGCISKTNKKNLFKLRIFCDNKYPKIIDEIIKSINDILPNSNARIKRHTNDNCSEIYVYSIHLLSLFPQHGSGKKHERQIILDDWQKEIIDEYPMDFLKGLIYTDGSFYYSDKYERCNFVNKSIDIINLCSETMNKLNISNSIRVKNKNSKYLIYSIDIQNQKELSKIPFRKS